MSYDKTKDYDLAGYDNLITDVGGNFSTNILQGKVHVHSCSPILDYADSNRHCKRKVIVDRIQMSKDATTPEQGAMLRDYNKVSSKKDLETKTLCFGRFQDCTITTTPWAICLQANYDIKLTQLAEGMTKTKTRYCMVLSYITAMFCCFQVVSSRS